MVLVEYLVLHRPYPAIMSFLDLTDNSIVLGLVPLHGLGGGDAVVDTDLGLAAAALGDTGTGAVPRLFVNIRGELP